MVNTGKHVFENPPNVCTFFHWPYIAVCFFGNRATKLTDYHAYRAIESPGSPTQPPTVVYKLKVQVEYTCIYTLHTHFCTFGADLYAQSVLINKISESELSRKFIKSALLVG